MKDSPLMQFHIISFEGPDAYARAGGISSRIEGLMRALDEGGHDTHLWFVGDPSLPGHQRSSERLYLHRWCQWISAFHRNGVYDGEDGKERDLASSLPPFLVAEHILPALARGERVVVLAEEWHTINAILHLDWLLRSAGVRDRVTLFWNANNTFGFEQIPWDRVNRACTVTTVSRYMRQRMWPLGVDPIVIPNGLGPEAYSAPFSGHVQELRRRLEGRTVLAKVARWDPDKRWLNAVDITAEVRARGGRPLLIARGGMEAHGAEVLARAQGLGLRVGERPLHRAGALGLIDAAAGTQDLDVLLLTSHVDTGARRLLLRGADAVLANSGHEPFGLVGLETMAAGGLACIGGTGEDYAVPGRNALVLQTEDPKEFVSLFSHLRGDPSADAEIRRCARRTARDYAWPEIVGRNLIPRIASAEAEGLRQQTRVNRIGHSLMHARRSGNIVHLPRPAVAPTPAGITFAEQTQA
jgi:glycosyltransferase involved in cell wall biosynthesis